VQPPLTEDQIRAVAAHIFTWRYIQPRRRLFRQGLIPSSLFGLSHAEIRNLGFPEPETRKFKKHYADLTEKEIRSCRQLGATIVFRDSPNYPPLLREIFHPPEFLYVRGDIRALQGNHLAVVGSRRGDRYGREMILRLLPGAVAAGLSIVSGMAYGIDSMAHLAALNSGGVTIGVNASGIDHLYPTGNQALFSRIIRNGCIVCEPPLGTPPLPFLFPIRNRVIAGLSRSVLVVQGAMRSGSLITARLALDQNRDLMAVPGPIESPLSEGPHHLIQQGAKLVQRTKDILEEYGLTSPGEDPATLAGLSSHERAILDLLKENAVKRIDDFVETLNLPVPAVVSLLRELSMKGLIREEGDGFRILICQKKH